MDSFSFLPNVSIFLFAISTTLIFLAGGKRRKVSFWLNILSNLIFVISIINGLEYRLGDFFYLSRGKIILLSLLGSFNILVAIVNGFEKIDNVQNSVLSSFVFIGAIFFLGAQEFLTFFVAMEIMGLAYCVLVGLTGFSNAKKVAVNLFIQGSVITVVFIFGVALFFGSTGALSFSDIVVKNHQIYALSLTFFFVTICFRMGIFPFHTWLSGVYANMNKNNLVTHFLIIKLTQAYVFITLFQKLLVLLRPEYQNAIEIGIIAVIITSALYGSVWALVERKFKGIIAASSMTHTAYMFITISLAPGGEHENQLLLYLLFYSLSVTGALLLINDYVDKKELENDFVVLEGGFYKSTFHAIKLTVFVLSLAGVPVTSGFVTKYLLLSSYFQKGHAFAAIPLLIITIFGLAYYIKFITALFKEDKTVGVEANGSVSLGHLRTDIVQFLLMAAVIVGGIMPSIFYNLIIT